MAKPSQPPQPGVKRVTRDTPGKESRNPIPEGSQHFGYRGGALFGRVVAAIPPGSFIETGKPGVSRVALNPRLL